MNRDKDSATTREAATWSVAASRYDLCHPSDSFSDLSHRARFSKEDRRLMEDWLAATKTLIETDAHVDERRTVTLNNEGATVDVAILADGLGIDVADVEPLMRQGKLTSTFEKGVGTDAGRSRLTFWLDAKRFRIVVDDQGTLLNTFRTDYGVLGRR